MVLACQCALYAIKLVRPTVGLRVLATAGPVTELEVVDAALAALDLAGFIYQYGPPGLHLTAFELAVKAISAAMDAVNRAAHPYQHYVESAESQN